MHAKFFHSYCSFDLHRLIDNFWSGFFCFYWRQTTIWSITNLLHLQQCFLQHSSAQQFFLQHGVLYSNFFLQHWVLYGNFFLQHRVLYNNCFLQHQVLYSNFFLQLIPSQYSNFFFNVLLSGFSWIFSGWTSYEKYFTQYTNQSFHSTFFLSSWSLLVFLFTPEHYFASCDFSRKDYNCNNEL